MRKLLAIMLFAFPWVATYGAPSGSIDLNKPGAMQELREFNPEHYRTITLILEGIAKQRDLDVPRWIETTYKAKDVSWHRLLMTSHPPQKRLTFTLDNVHYEALVRLTNVRAEIVPAN
jgi:hypothetical protein